MVFLSKLHKISNLVGLIKEWFFLSEQQISNQVGLIKEQFFSQLINYTSVGVEKNGFNL